MQNDIRLFSPYSLRGITFANRVMISPMSQYSAIDGQVQDWHRYHIGNLAKGGAGSVMVEASAVTATGRGTWGDLGIWSDDHISGLRELAHIIDYHGAVPAIQIGHAGRKGSTQRPWEGNVALRGDAGAAEPPWQTVGPSAHPIAPEGPAPRQLAAAELPGLVDAFRAAALRAVAAGFKLIEVHAAHGYLLHSFLSPLSNLRDDAYGGTFENRIRFPLEVMDALRQALPDDIALSVRVSAVDGAEGGWELQDTILFAQRLKALGVDIIDCSSGGIQGPATAASGPKAVKRGPGFQVPFAHAVKHGADIPTIAVGLITEPAQAEQVLAQGKADLIAIGREALVNPNWALHAKRALGLDLDYASWPQQYGWWLKRRPPISAS